MAEDAQSNAIIKIVVTQPVSQVEIFPCDVEKQDTWRKEEKYMGDRSKRVVA